MCKVCDGLFVFVGFGAEFGNVGNCSCRLGFVFSDVGGVFFSEFIELESRF